MTVLDFARYLADRADEKEWERKLEDPRYEPRLRALMDQVANEIAAGADRPLDPRQL